MEIAKTLTRCSWPGLDKSERYQRYHDHEWGMPSYTDKHLFEMLVLESFQSGLSWLTILNKRDAFRSAFDDFNVEKIADYDPTKISELLNNTAIIRSVGKIKATILNARIFIEIQKEWDTFSNYIWSFTDHNIIYDHPITTQSELSFMISKD